MTTEEYKDEHRKIGIEHEAMIEEALCSYSGDREYKVERWRPEKSGDYGRFETVSVEQVEQSD